jgi:HEPN domain-containing protein
MRTPEQVKWDFVQQWIGKAQKDLRAAEILLRGEDLGDYDSVGFHAQQAAEKFMKAVLVRHQVEFPKTHDIALIRRLIAQVNQSLSARLAPGDVLTSYAVDFRYPGDSPPLTKDGGTQALQLAQQVGDVVLDHLKPYFDAGRP